MWYLKKFIALIFQKDFIDKTILYFENEIEITFLWNHSKPC